MIELKGITWDHKRGYDPLIETTKEFTALHPDVKISWNRRSLKEFGDFPVEVLSEQYDILLIDHPFTGEAAQKNLYVDLSSCISQEHLNLAQQESVGQCFESYCYNGQVLALPVDAAAVVSAGNGNYFQSQDWKIPTTLEEIFALYDKLPPKKKILLGLCPTDIWCVFLSLCAVATDGEFIHLETGIDQTVAQQQIEHIAALAKLSAKNPFALNPIQILDLISTDDTYIYSPFLFGYVNYGFSDNRYPITFYNTPLDLTRKLSGILGGVGIAISTKSHHIEMAAEYVKYVTTPSVQSGTYFASGGQPAQKMAWESIENNNQCGNFFQNTRHTIEHAYLRPRFPGWNCFQEDASKLLCAQVEAGVPSAQIAAEINELFFLNFGKEKMG